MSDANRKGEPDSARRGRGRRKGRETGCSVYITGEQLVEAGFNPKDPPPYYRAHAHRHSANTGRVIVSLYREP